MQLFVLILVMSIFAHDALAYTLFPPSEPAWPWIVAYLLAAPLLAGAYTWCCHRTLSRLSIAPAATLRSMDLCSAAYRFVVLALHVIGLWGGVLGFIRSTLGDPVLLDELVLLSVPLALVGWGWWAFYPIDLRLRHATLIRHLDQGQPVTAIWSRSQFVYTQFRHQVLLILIPISALMGWSEVVHGSLLGDWSAGGPLRGPLALLAGAGVVFLLTPVVIRHVWDTEPLPPGPLRDELAAMCRRYQIGVRQLLLWRTFGCVVNAAVMGVIAPFRYILISDALLERLPQRCVEAVMAHELAHIRWHHMFWLMMAAAAAIAGPSAIWWLVTETAIQQAHAGFNYGRWAVVDQLLIEQPEVVTLLGVVVVGASWVGLFGWISRRFERQADTFAVVHLARYAQRPTAQQQADPTAIDIGSIRAMTDALGQVADLSHTPAGRRSWRHGSIAWRQDYLRRLAGVSVDRLAIDRQVQVIKVVSAATIVLLAIGRWLVS